MSRKRSNEMILQNILEVCSDGASKTKIVYQSNLNSTTVNIYMAQLINNGLLEINLGHPTVYITTKEGHEFMRRLKQHHEEILRIMERYHQDRMLKV